MTLRTNYNKVCLYCGVTFKSNRNTAQYCCGQHGSMYRLHGRSEELWNQHGVILENNNKCILENNKHAIEAEALAFVEQATRQKVQELWHLNKQYKEALQNAYNYYLNPAQSYWSMLLAASVLRNRFQFKGLLPTEKDGIIIQGGFLIQLFIGDLYKIKPIELCRSEELKTIRWQWASNG